MEGVTTVFHLAANADVRGGQTDRNVDLQQTFMGTHQVLEAMKAVSATQIVLTSSATVYGRPNRFPTPEDTPRSRLPCTALPSWPQKQLFKRMASTSAYRAIFFDLSRGLESVTPME